MPLKVMLSSVRTGLADVRDAVAPVLRILDYECIRFEGVTSEPVPPRAVCVRMVEECAIYLLLLGDRYGEPMAGTDMAPTEEEWTVARNLGRPTVVFKREDTDPEPRQEAFIREVEAYESGAWRGTFRDIPDLLAQLKPALSSAAATLQPLGSLRPLESAVAVPWREPDVRGQVSGRSALETHVLPVGPVTPLSATTFGDLRTELTRVGQDHGLFELGEALDFQTTSSGISARSRPDGRRSEAGVSLTRGRVLSVWEQVPGQVGGSVLDEHGLRARVARDLRLAAGVRVLTSEETTIAIGFDRVDMLGIANGQNSMTYPFMGRGVPVRVEPTEAVPVRALASAADELASELVARLILVLHDTR